MSVNTNLVIIGGNIGKSPVLRRTSSGRAVLNFSLANDRIRQISGATERTTTWHDITVWDEKAEHNAQHLTSGSEVLVTGKLNVRHYQDREGRSRRQVEIIASKIDWIKLNPKRKQPQSQDKDTSVQLTTDPQTVSLNS